MTEDKIKTFKDNAVDILRDTDIQTLLASTIDAKCDALAQAAAELADKQDFDPWKAARKDYAAAVEEGLRHLSPEDRAKVEALSAQAQEAGIGSGMDAVLTVAHSQVQSLPKLKEALDRCSDKPQPGL